MGAARRLGMCEAGHAIESSAKAGKGGLTLCRVTKCAHRMRIAIASRSVSIGSVRGLDILFLKNKISAMLGLSPKRH